jgi:hypothetical protein
MVVEAIIIGLLIVIAGFAYSMIPVREDEEVEM